MNADVFVQAIPEIVTQLVAFLVVFWVLKKYAFGAILKGIETRQKDIADQFASAEKSKTAAAEMEKEYRARLQHIEQESRAKIQEAVAEGQRLAQEIREKARQDAAREAERAKADIGQELAKARASLRGQVVELSSKMAEKIIRKNLTAKDDEAFIDDLLREAEKV